MLTHVVNHRDRNHGTLTASYIKRYSNSGSQRLVLSLQKNYSKTNLTFPSCRLSSIGYKKSKQDMNVTLKMNGNHSFLFFVKAEVKYM